MKHATSFQLLALVAVCAATLASSVPAPSTPPGGGSIVAGAPMSAPRSGHTATLLPNGKVLIAGGMRRNQDFYRSAELFDPGTGTFHTTGESITYGDGTGEREARVAHARQGACCVPEAAPKQDAACCS